MTGAGSFRVDWRSEPRSAVFMVMEAAWLAALALVVDANFPGPQTPAIALGLIAYPAAYVIARPARPQRWHPLLNILAGGLGGMIALAIGAWIAAPLPWSSEVLAAHPYRAGLLAGVIAVAWARGWLLGQRRLDVEGVVAGFQLGIVVLLLVAWLDHVGPRPTGHFVGLAAVFMAAGLFGLRLARTAASDRPVSPVRTAATVLAAIGILLVIGLGVLAGREFNRELMETLLAPLFWLWHMLGRFFLWLFSLLPEPSRPPMPIAPRPAMPAPPPDPRPLFDISKWMHLIGQIMFYGAVGYMAVMLLFRTLYDLMKWIMGRRPPTDDIQIEKSDFGFWDEIAMLFRAIVAWLARLVGRFRRVRPVVPTSPETRDVREVYRRLLAWAARNGCARRPAATPHEFLEFLRPRLPDHEFDLRFLTEAYAAARYGAAHPAPDILTRAKAAWRRVRAERFHAGPPPEPDGV